MQVMGVYSDRLHSAEWEVRPIKLLTAIRLVQKYHYARGGSNTATYLHGLFRRGVFEENECSGIVWWIPPTKSAAMATFPANWKGVLALSRLVVIPNIPKNACSFLLAHSMKLIDRFRWPCLVTYADEWQGHIGTIYKASNWQEVGLTSPEATWVINGRMVSRKAGPRTRTKAEMEEMGAVMVGRYAKHKFVHIVGKKY